MSDWFLRFALGLPPRPYSKDKEYFLATFPEAIDGKEKFMSGTNSFIFADYFEVDPRLKRVDDGWFCNKDNKDRSKSNCSVIGCQLKIKDGVVVGDTRLNSPFYELVVGPYANFKNSNDVDEFAKKIINYFPERDHESVFYYVDPYLLKSCFPKNVNNDQEKTLFALNFISKLNVELPGIKFMTSNDGANYKSSSDYPDKLFKIIDCDGKDFQFHDRFLLHKNGDSYSGLMIGNSVNSFQGGRYYLMVKIDEADSKELYGILQNSGWL